MLSRCGSKKNIVRKSTTFEKWCIIWKPKFHKNVPLSYRQTGLGPLLSDRGERSRFNSGYLRAEDSSAQGLRKPVVWLWSFWGSRLFQGVISGQWARINGLRFTGEVRVNFTHNPLSCPRTLPWPCLGLLQIAPCLVIQGPSPYIQPRSWMLSQALQSPHPLIMSHQGTYPP